MFRLLVSAAFLLLAARYAEAGGCHQLFVHHRPHVQQVVAVPVVQNYFHAVGESLLIDAIVDRKVNERLQQLQAPAKSPVTGSVLSAKCARCHQGESAKGGVNFADGVDDLEFRQTVRVLSGYDVPAAMKALVGSLSAADKGAITQEMLGLPAKKEEPAVAPSPFDQPGELK